MVKHVRREALGEAVGSILDKYIFIQECVYAQVMREPRRSGTLEALNEHKGG